MVTRHWAARGCKPPQAAPAPAPAAGTWIGAVGSPSVSYIWSSLSAMPAYSVVVSVSVCADVTLGEGLLEVSHGVRAWVGAFGVSVYRVAIHTRIC